MKNNIDEHKKMAEKIILVDENDNKIGIEDKEKCHDGKGILHRAFVVMLLNEKGDVLLSKRSSQKRLWPGFWEATVASHPRENEIYESAAIRRVKDELGINVEKPKLVFKFRYQVPYKDEGSENELCALLVCRYQGQPNPIPSEISQTKLLSLKQLKPKDPTYAPWTQITIEKLIKEKIDIQNI